MGLDICWMGPRLAWYYRQGITSRPSEIHTIYPSPLCFIVMPDEPNVTDTHGKGQPIGMNGSQIVFCASAILGLSLWRFGSQYKGVGYPLDLRYDRFISNKGKASGHILFPMTYRTGVHNIVSKTIFPL